MPVTVVRRADPAAVSKILASVPEWFGIPEANASYVAEAERLPSYLAVEGDDVLGVALLSEHFPQSPAHAGHRRLTHRPHGLRLN